MSGFHIFDCNANGFDALLCLDGTLPCNDDIYRYFSEKPIIAADGAALQLRKKGIQPQFIIGDLDAFNASASVSEFPNALIIQISEQETNDFEKCLQFCQRSNFNSILICGLHGGLAEHSLNNWSVFMRYANVLSLCLYEAGRYGIPIRSSLELSTTPEEIISLVPQTEARISTKGLRWSLHNEWLKLGEREGARNRAIGQTVSIELHEGSLLVFCEARLPFHPNPNS